MIVVQTPLRVSFFGGGTDFSEFYLKEGGCVLTTAIDKYIFVIAKHRFDEKLRIGWTQTEMVENLDDISHELIREALRMTGIKKGVEISTLGDIPSAGSGLGSSSTVTVGALHAMFSLNGQLVSAQQLAELACDIEIDILKKPIGIQDQYIAAFGGLRFLEFTREGEVHQKVIDLDINSRRYFNEITMLFFTGVTRKSSVILKEQKKNIDKRLPVFREIKDIAYAAFDEIIKGNIDALGSLLHESWQLKKGLSSQISNGILDNMYMAAIKAGAIGGKITGAGGGGFLLLICPHSRQNHVRQALKGLQELPFLLGADGSKVIFNYQRM